MDKLDLYWSLLHVCVHFRDTLYTFDKSYRGCAEGIEEKKKPRIFLFLFVVEDSRMPNMLGERYFKFKRFEAKNIWTVALFIIACGRKSLTVNKPNITGFSNWSKAKELRWTINTIERKSNNNSPIHATHRGFRFVDWS